MTDQPTKFGKLCQFISDVIGVLSIFVLLYIGLWAGALV